MNVLRDEDFKLFKGICSLTKEQLYATLKRYLIEIYGEDKVFFQKLPDERAYIYAIGEIPIAMVAHMDTVFPTPPTQIFYDREQGVIWSPQGGCGDDRSGVFGILKILKAGYRPSVIFTNDEEIGCVGAYQFVEDFPKAKSELKYLIQLDRRGTSDCVFYDCDNPDFVSYVENFGFIENMGSFSDISVICPAWGIAGVNLSIGYIGEHFETELVYVNPMMKTIEKAKKMLAASATAPSFQYIEKYKITRNWRWFSSPEEEDLIPCESCGKPNNIINLVPVHKKNGQVIMVCGDCLPKVANWCYFCNRAFTKGDKNHDSQICYTCREARKKKKKDGN